MTRRRRAFSLIETLIVVAVGTSMFVMLGFLLTHFNGTTAYEQAASQSSGSASTILKEIESLALPADAILASHAFSSGTYASATTTLVLEIPSLDSSGNAIANTYDYAAFYATSTSAYRLLEANALSARTSGTKLLSSTVSSLSFAYGGADLTKVGSTTVDIQTRAVVRQNVLTDHRHELIRLRNY